MRKGHGSTKVWRRYELVYDILITLHQVPNVKLRPAAANPRMKSKLLAEAAWADADQVEEIEKLKLGGKRPLRRIVISASGVADKVLSDFSFQTLHLS